MKIMLLFVGLLVSALITRFVLSRCGCFSLFNTSNLQVGDFPEVGRGLVPIFVVCMVGEGGGYNSLLHDSINPRGAYLKFQVFPQQESNL